MTPSHSTGTAKVQSVSDGNDLSDLLGPDNLATALNLAKRGFRVFPITLKDHGGWTPIKDWQANATTDPAQLRTWWLQWWPDARLGLPTGAANGITVLDIDRKNGKDGFATLRAMGFDPDKLSAIMVATPSSGRHVIFAYCPGLKNSVGKIGDGLDVRNDGGFIVAPGSYKGGKLYKPLSAPLGSAELPPFPQTLIPPERPAANPYDLSDILGPEPVDWGEVRDALGVLNPDCGRDEWVRIGMALHHASNGSDEAFALWDEWSATAKEPGMYQRKQMRGQWRSFGKGTGKPVTIASLFDLALKCGWSRDPAVSADDFEDLLDLDTDATAPAPRRRQWHVADFPARELPDLTHDQLATDLGKAGWDEDARYVAQLGGWHLWKESHWEQPSGTVPMAMVRSYVNAKADALIRWGQKEAKRKNNREPLEEVQRQAKGLRQEV